MPVQWAMTQNNLGATRSRNQGTRTSGEDGTRLLAEAVTAYRAALEVHTREAMPVDWATTQNNLGNALQQPGHPHRRRGRHPPAGRGRRRLPRSARGPHPRGDAGELGHDAEEYRTDT